MPEALCSIPRDPETGCGDVGNAFEASLSFMRTKETVNTTVYQPRTDVTLGI